MAHTDAQRPYLVNPSMPNRKGRLYKSREIEQEVSLSGRFSYSRCSTGLQKSDRNNEDVSQKHKLKIPFYVSRSPSQRAAPASPPQHKQRCAFSGSRFRNIKRLAKAHCDLKYLSEK